MEKQQQQQDQAEAVVESGIENLSLGLGAAPPSGSPLRPEEPEDEKSAEEKAAQIQASNEPKKFMVCVDASPNCESAFKSAVSWMKEKDELVIVNAPEVYQPRVLLPAWGDRADVNKKIVERGQEICDYYVKRGQEAKVANVYCRVLVNFKVSPKQAVVDFADENNIHTIFVGTRGLGYVRTFFVGGFSRFLVQNAHCNVMVVKPKAEDGEGQVQPEGPVPEPQAADVEAGSAEPAVSPAE